MVLIRRYSLFTLILPWSLVLVCSLCVAALITLYFQLPLIIAGVLGVAMFTLLFHYAKPSPSALLVCPRTKTIHTQVFYGKSPTPVDVSDYDSIRTVFNSGAHDSCANAAIYLVGKDSSKYLAITRYNLPFQFLKRGDEDEPPECRNARLLLMKHLNLSINTEELPDLNARLMSSQLKRIKKV